MTYYKFDDGSVMELNHEPKDGTKITRKAFIEGRKEYARRELLKLFSPGDAVTVVPINSQGSQFRVFAVDTYRDTDKKYVRDVTWLVQQLNGASSDYIKMSGYGYSRSFQIVYNLGMALWPDGTPEPHGRRNGEPDSNGGYALKQA